MRLVNDGRPHRRGNAKQHRGQREVAREDQVLAGASQRAAEREPDLARLKQMAVDLDCASRITFTGLLPPPDVAARLREADVLILPNRPSAISTDFTSPLKLFEYMASGRPIVASDLPAFREILRDGENALLVEAGNPQALVAGITRIKDDPALAARLARQAAADVRDYTWPRRAARLEAHFRTVVEAR